MTVFREVYRWVRMQRGVDTYRGYLPDLRLTRNQAMQLCWEYGTRGWVGFSSKALWAYACDRPWDFLKHANLYGARLVPYLAHYAKKAPL